MVNSKQVLFALSVLFFLATLSACGGGGGGGGGSSPPAGSLDSGFGTNGIMTTAIGTINDYATAIALQSDGKIVVAGSTYNGTYDFALVRYNANGSLDTSFDTDGIVTTAVGTSNDYATAIALQSDGKIVVAGRSSFISTNDDIALVRYNANGSLDTSFDTDGIVTTAVSASADHASAIALQSDGKIVVAGGKFANNGNDDYDIALVRYNP